MTRANLTVVRRPSGAKPVPDNPYPVVPREQVDGDVFDVARTEGRNLYIPVQDDECVREQVWPRGEHVDRVVVEIRPLPRATTGADDGYCMTWGGSDGLYVVIELAEPLGDRRLVMTHYYGAPPS